MQLSRRIVCAAALGGAAATSSKALFASAGVRAPTSKHAMANSVGGRSSASGFPITEHVLKTDRHTSFYLACGDVNSPLIIFVHGWPELSHSWRHQLPVFAALGFRVIAPDMRGYGRSSVYSATSDYTLEAITADMRELLNGLGRQKAIWVGHDWGSPVVWSLASHHPEICEGVANLCVPYVPNGESFLSYIDRSVYPADKYPVGQWDYWYYYAENFTKAHTEFEANVSGTVKLLFRKGNPEGMGKPAFTASIRANGGWFAEAHAAPDLPRDADVLTETDLDTYTAALTRNGFAGPDSWYMNPAANAAYGANSVNGGRLTMPVLFLHAQYDYVCQTVTSELASPMRAYCNDLTEGIVRTGHWMAQENPVAVNKALAAWISAKLPDLWWA